MKIVLDFGHFLQQIPSVVVINHGQAAECLGVGTGIDFLLDKGIADQIPQGLRARLITATRNKAVVVFQQSFINADAESNNITQLRFFENNSKSEINYFSTNPNFEGCGKNFPSSLDFPVSGVFSSTMIVASGRISLKSLRIPISSV